MSYFDSIYADTLLPPRAVSVYMYLKDRSNSAGSCWPGIKTISHKSGVSVEHGCGSKMFAANGIYAVQAMTQRVIA